jgi:hypothetical protein
MPMLTRRFEEALIYAMQVHALQNREGPRSPTSRIYSPLLPSSSRREGTRTR